MKQNFTGGGKSVNFEKCVQGKMNKCLYIGLREFSRGSFYGTILIGIVKKERQMQDKEKHYIYILKCADGSLYTGYTNDLGKRLKAHNDGTGAKYTKARLPVEMVYHEEFDEKKEAMSREWFIKHRLSRDEKLALISGKQ